MVALRRLSLLLLVLVIASCSATREHATPQPQPATLLEGIPFPVDRDPSAVVTYSALGHMAVQRSPGAQDDWPYVKLPANPGGMEWAIFQFTPNAGESPYSVAFDFVDPFDEAAHDEAWAGIANFTSQRWDFSPAVNPAGLSATADHISPLGNVFVVVCAVDTHFAHISEVIFKTNTGTGGWVIASPAPYNKLGSSFSIATVNGNPALSFRGDDDDSETLNFIRAGDALGSDWLSNPTVVVHDLPPGWSVDGSSLAVIDGRPAIAFGLIHIDSSSYTLQYVRANDATGETWGTPQKLSDMYAVGNLLEVNGRPAVIYCDTSDISGWGELHFIRASDAVGTTWDPPVVADDGGGVGTVGEWPSMAIIDGHPAVSYFDRQANWALRYVRANDADGSSWGTPVLVDDPPVDGHEAGRGSSLAEVNGRPAIAYNTDIDFQLGVRYVRSADSTGAVWEPPLVLENGSFSEASMCVADGRPAVAYFDWDQGELRFTWSDDADGTAWSAPISLPSTMHLYLKIAEVNGQPAICFSKLNSMEYAFYQP